MSLIVPPPFAIPTDPKKPANVRHMIKQAKFGLSAVGICSKAKMEKQVKYSIRRPNVSDSGASIRGPIPRDTTKAEVAATT